MIGELTRAVLYVRVSTEEQTTNTSPEYQRQECARRASAIGAQVVAVCEDLGVSGTRYQTRPGIQEALAYVERGEADCLIALKLDRIGRSTRVVLDVAERVDRAGGRIITGDGMELGGTPGGKMQLTLLAAFAQFERDSIRERTMSGKKEQAKQNRQPARGQRPFGYTIICRKDVAAGLYPADRIGEYIIREDEARHVVALYERYAAGESLTQLCAYLRAGGALTGRGRDVWRQKTVRQILMNPLYKGTARFGLTSLITREAQDGIHITTKRHPEADWQTWDVPAIVPPGLWESVQEQLGRARAVRGGWPTRKYLLSGFVRCPECGIAMGCRIRTDTKSGTRAPYFECIRHKVPKKLGGPFCEYRPIHSARRIEPMVLHAIEEFAQRPEMLAAAVQEYRRGQARTYDASEHARIEKQIRDMEAREQKTLELQLDAAGEGLDTRVFTNKLKTIQEGKAALLKRLHEVEAAAGAESVPSDVTDAAITREALADLLEALYSPDLTDVEKRAVLGRIVDFITPGKTEVSIRLLPGFAAFAGPSLTLTEAKVTVTLVAALKGEVRVVVEKRAA